MRRRSKTRPSSIRPATRRTPPTHPPAPRPAARATGPEPVLPPRPARKSREALYVYAGMVVMLLLCVSGIVYIIQPQPTALAAADPMRQAIEDRCPPSGGCLSSRAWPSA